MNTTTDRSDTAQNTSADGRRSDRHYDVVAMSFPIVYSLEGDHDPNGMLYTLRVYKPILDWAKKQWKANNEYLPAMHRKRQLMETVVDGIPRFQRMREILAEGGLEHRYLLREFGAEREVLEREASDDHRPPPTPRERAVRQNYRDTVDALVSALKELSRGRITRLSPDPAVLDSWWRNWRDQLDDVDAAMETRLAEVNELLPELLQRYPAAPADPADPADLCTEHLHRADVERLLFNDHSPAARQAPLTAARRYDRFNPLRPIPVVRPLVLRACRGETVQVHFENQIRGREVGMHLQGDGLGGLSDGARRSGVRHGDGARVGTNPDSTVPHGQDIAYVWDCSREGVWPINDLGDVRGTDRGTNNHGLFAALVVEPEGARWYDPETGCPLDTTDHPDGLYVDVVPVSEQPLRNGAVQVPPPCPGDRGARHGCAAENRCRRWREENFIDFHHARNDAQRWAGDCSFREFTVFFHDEPETRSGIPHPLPHSAMPLSYRAEPMHNRLPYRMRQYARATADQVPAGQQGIDHAAVKIDIDETLGEVFWVARDQDGKFLERVSGEEQHHSAWLFGDSVTPILRAYRGDPCRVRLVHAGVKETHVFHLHVHQWRAVAQDTARPSEWDSDQPHGSQLLDSISIGPQTAMTIDPLYGSGSRQHAVGDIIWHCHLYPHFHHGMWGLWRSFDREVTGKRAYPDGTPCPALQPLPGRAPQSSEEQPGFPWFIDATFPRKSPPPPALRPQDEDGRRQLLGMGLHSPQERGAFDPGCLQNPQPGALFVDLDGLAAHWNNDAGVPERRLLSYDIAVRARKMTYNSSGWYDPHGHFYELTGVEVTRLAANGTPVGDAVRFDPPSVRPDGGVEAFFPRANHGDIVEWRLHNMVGSFGADHFDLPAHPVECGLHVHLVKFDVLAADGSSSGWNYLSGASSPEAIGPNRPGRPDRNVSLHRWVVDEEFGTCFFHDHLLANYRQKRGLFAALVAEPNGTRWCLPDQKTPAWVGTQAVIRPRENGASGLREAFREAGLALGDFVPLCRADGDPLNEPNLLGGDDDPGVMGVNYRCAPLEHRGKDPSEWFSSSRSSLRREDGKRKALDVTDASPLLPVPLKDPGDPDTSVIYTYPGERLRLRIFQGSHEEQHSFMLNGMRWRKDWHSKQAPLVNQQTLGISEAFTVDVDPEDAAPYGIGDHLWQFTVMDDLWLGCWGLIRALPRPVGGNPAFPPLPGVDVTTKSGDRTTARNRHVPDRPAHRPVHELLHGVRPGAPADGVREYVVVARRHEHLYAGTALTDPWGLIYRPAEGAVPEQREDGTPTGNLRAVGVDSTDEPLVLRAHPGEWLRVVLINEVLLPKEDDEQQAAAVGHRPAAAVTDELRRAEDDYRRLPPFGPEISPPRLPVEHRDHLGHPDRRAVSPRVSLHPSLLHYDVTSDDGAWVGHNHDSTIAALDVDDAAHVVHGGHEPAVEVVHRTDHGIGHRDPNWREYWWYVDDQLAPQHHAQGPGQTCYLFDMGDIRNHRHHGLIGAVVAEPADVVPVDPKNTDREKWSGVHVHLKSGKELCAQEHVVFLQDGLRHFLRGDIDQPVPDVSPSDPPVDSGQKAINYRSPLTPTRYPLADDKGVVEALAVLPDKDIWWRIVCAGDKPRNHTFTLHGFAWHAARWPRQDGQEPASAQTGSVTAISAGYAMDLAFKVKQQWDAGDHAYRSGAFRWAVSQGMWGILRVP